MFEKQRNDNFSFSIRCGRLTDHSELRTGDDGRQFVRFSIAVNRNAEKADYFNYIAFNDKARFIDRYCHKGTKVIIIGIDETSSYQDKKGVKHKTNTTICEDIHIVKKGENVSLVPEWIKKMVPKKPLNHDGRYYGKTKGGNCPVCGSHTNSSMLNYCRKCGQKLDWECEE